jgi:hypothetical protein
MDFKEHNEDGQSLIWLVRGQISDPIKVRHLVAEHTFGSRILPHGVHNTCFCYNKTFMINYAYKIMLHILLKTKRYKNYWVGSEVTVLYFVYLCQNYNELFGNKNTICLHLLQSSHHLIQRSM